MQSPPRWKSTFYTVNQHSSASHQLTCIYQYMLTDAKPGMFTDRVEHTLQSILRDKEIDQQLVVEIL